jgi:N-acylneuraminate cytidylyltransferase
LKNIKLLAEKPLVAWCLSALQDAGSVDGIVVATDSADIKRVVLGLGLSKVTVYDRDAVNAADTSSTESVMLEYLAKVDFAADDRFMLVQATSPFTTSADVDGMLSVYAAGRYDSMLSAVRTKRFFWDNNGAPVNYDFRNRPRRQDFDGWLMENGALYVNRVGNILREKNRLSGKVGVYEMPEYTGLEIDESHDWFAAEVYLRNITGGV